MRLSNIVKKPIITEKSFDLVANNMYVFEVDKTATKGSIAENLKKLYGVDVVEVKTIVLPGKKRRVAGTRNFTKSSKWKKAVVKLKAGQSIYLFPKE